MKILGNEFKTPKDAIEHILDELYIVEDNTGYDIKEISKAIDLLQKINFKGETNE